MVHLLGRRGVGDPQEFGEHRRHGCEVAVVGHETRVDQVRVLFLRDGRENLRHTERVRTFGFIVLDVDGAVRTHSESGSQRLGYAIGPNRDSDDLTLTGVLGLQGLFERIGVVGVDFEFEVVFPNPGAIRPDVEARILIGNLLEANHDLHGGVGLQTTDFRCGFALRVSEATTHAVAKARGNYPTIWPMTSCRCAEIHAVSKIEWPVDRARSVDCGGRHAGARRYIPPVRRRY